MSGDEAVFVAVLVMRLGVPLLIPRFPLPAILASLVIDAADQTIFQNWTDLDLDGYQGYDKALDVYYLTIAYLATVRNWLDGFTFDAGRFLWYYRLSGVVLFELLGWRALLIIFANTFEYFFIYYETARTRWNVRRLGHRHVIAAIAIIWVFIKLPQEWWIHVAQLDFTDFLKEDVLGVTADTSWGDALSENLWVVPVLLVVAVGLAFGVRAISNRLPPPDWGFTVDVDRHLDRPPMLPASEQRPPKLVSWYVFEKIALVSMVSIIFGQVLPDVEASPLQMTFGVAVVIVANTLVSHWFTGRGTEWSNIFVQFLAMAAVNAGIVVVYDLLLGERDLNAGPALFFVLLLTLIVTLFDRFRSMREQMESTVSAVSS